MCHWVTHPNAFWAKKSEMVSIDWRVEGKTKEWLRVNNQHKQWAGKTGKNNNYGDMESILSTDVELRRLKCSNLCHHDQKPGKLSPSTSRFWYLQRTTRNGIGLFKGMLMHKHGLPQNLVTWPILNIEHLDIDHDMCLNRMLDWLTWLECNKDYNNLESRINGTGHNGMWSILY